MNKSHSHLRGYFKDKLLKLTFSYKDRLLAHAFHDELERTHHVRSGFYHRYSGETTVVVALKKSCKNQSMVAFRVFQMALRYLRQIEDIESCDSRFLLATKFFLEYLCAGLSVYIKPTIHKEDCVFVTRGSRKRMDMIRDCLNVSFASEDMKHEVEHLLKRMEEDPYGEVTVMIPASVVWSDKENKSLCELDGMVLEEEPCNFTDPLRCCPYSCEGCGCVAEACCFGGWVLFEGTIISFYVLPFPCSCSSEQGNGAGACVIRNFLVLVYGFLFFLWVPFILYFCGYLGACLCVICMTGE